MSRRCHAQARKATVGDRLISPGRGGQSSVENRDRTQKRKRAECVGVVCPAFTV
jgi:hypothetical protein